MKRRWIKTLAWVAAAVSGGAILAAAAFVAAPLPPELFDPSAHVSVHITDRDGHSLRELRSAQEGSSEVLQGTEIPPLVEQAFIAAEDKRFYSHPGVDVVAVARAASLNLRKQRIASGASTITMQLARYLVPHERTLWGKCREMMWALRLSAHLDREDILRGYLNRVSLGNSVYGAEAAAQTYFGRPAARLSVGQAALIAGMASSPARYNPYRNIEAAQQRKAWVLDRMVRLGMIDSASAKIEGAAPLDVVDRRRAFRAPHLTTHLVMNRTAMGLADAVRVETTIDPVLQEQVEEIVATELAALEDKRVGQAAVIVIDNESGEVLAYVGSREFFDAERGGQNDGVQALRQPGSALKPFAYGLALSGRFTPATVLSDLEVHLSTPSGDYVPRNYDRRLHGPVRLRSALQNSYNVPAVRLAEQLHPARVLTTLREAGLQTLDREPSHYGVGVVLGNGDVTLYDLARAYRGLARGGVVEPLTTVRQAWDAAGNELELPPEIESHRFLPEEAVGLLTDILSDNAARIPAFGRFNPLRLSFPVAAKTGTSRAYIDNWAVGYTHERTVGVWVGNFDGTAMRHVSGITGAGPLFGHVMTAAMQGIRPAKMVDRSRYDHVRICALSGQRATEACAGHVDEIFLSGTAPRDGCRMHAIIGGKRVLDVGPEYYAWARGEGIQSALRAPVSGEARILSPGRGDEYLIEPGIPHDDQSIAVRILPPRGVRDLEVRLSDGSTVALGPPYATRIPARRGKHRLELWIPGDAQPVATTTFVVR